MTSITELTPVKVYEYKRAITASGKQADVIRSLMLDLLAKAYDGTDFIHFSYYDRANDLLNTATCRSERLFKAIMRKEGLV